MKPKLSDHLRIVWSITAKDFSDALKNKNILALILTALFIIVVYKYLPGLYDEDGPPKLLVYDPGDSILLAKVSEDPAIDLYTYESEEDMKYYLTNGNEPELGLVIPDNWDSTPYTDHPLELRGYVLHLFKDRDILVLKNYMEDELGFVLERPVEISIEKIQIQPETFGITVLTSMGFVFVTIVVGMMVIPHMMVEEKQAKTIKVLMISPAGSHHIVFAKVLTGLACTWLMLLIAVGFNWVLIQQRWLFLLGGFLGAVFSVSLGMMLGILIDSRQQLTLWAWIGFIPLLLPMFLSLDGLLPTRIAQVFQWIPSSALFRIFRTSMAGTAPVKYYGPQFIVLLLSSVIFITIDAWLVRRLDR